MPVQPAGPPPIEACEPYLVEGVTLTLCSLCLNGAGGQCHTPGCALYMSAGPDLPLWHYVVDAMLDLEEP